MEQQQKTIAKIVSLLVAILLWARFSGMVEESERMLEQVFSPINVVYTKGDKMKVNANNYQFQVTLSGPRNQLQQVEPKDLLVTLDLTGYDQGTYTLPLTPSNVSVPNQLGQLTVVEVVPDQVALEMVRIGSKKLNIVATAIGEPHRNYELVDIELEPTEVTIEGPVNRIDDATILLANPIDISGLKKTKIDKITFNFEEQIPQDTIIREDFQKFRYRAIIRERTDTLAPEEGYKIGFDSNQAVLIDPPKVKATITGPTSIIRWIDPSWLRPMVEIPPSFGEEGPNGVVNSMRVPVSSAWDIPLPLLSLKPDLLNNTRELNVVWTPNEVEVRKP